MARHASHKKSARDDAERAMVRYAAELGITPSSRGWVNAAPQDREEANPFSLIDGGKEPD